MTKAASDQPNLLRTKRYALFWVSSLLSNIGTWMQQVAQPWVILSVTNSSFLVGLDSFAMNAPGWVFTLWGGSLADRFDRKRIIMICQSVQFVCVFTLLVLLLTRQIQVWTIILTSFLVGATDSLSMPAFQTIIPSLVKPKDIPRAVALNSAQFNLSRVLGPALAGIMIAAYGAVFCFGANLVSFIPFFLSIFWIYPRGGLPKTAHPPAATVATISESQFFEIARSREVRIPLATLLVTTVFCSPIITFCPVIVKETFKAGADQLGWSMAVFGSGGVIGAMISSLLASEIYTSRRFASGVACALGLTVLGTALAPTLVAVDAFLFISGAALTMSNTSINSSLQKSSGAHNRGRVASLFQLALHGGISLGSFLTGLMASGLGIKTALIINGTAAAGLQAFLWGLSSIRRATQTHTS